jgi:hypothetical protein
MTAVDRDFAAQYGRAIESAAQSLIAENITDEETWERSIREETDQFGWYCGTDMAYDTLRASRNADALENRIGYEDQDIFDLIGMAAAFAVEGDIADALGGDFAAYREKCEEGEG